VDLEDIAQRTKNTAGHLRSIEGENYDKLPAPVYVRGFVVELAKFLKLEPARVAASYMRRMVGGSTT
jgi:flagellar biosynthesis protein FlhG